MLDRIAVRGARQHNLQGVNVEIPRNSLTVVTGLSGSGKSSLAFDTIYAEGQRRYVETLSPYARQFLEQFDRPDVDSIDGLSPALSIEQKTASRSTRSTVGTVTEIYDYLRLLYSAIGTPYCVKCDRLIEKQSAEQVAARIIERGSGTNVSVLAPCVRGRKGMYRAELAKYLQKGFVSARIDGRMTRLDGPRDIKLARSKEHTIEVLVDRVKVREASEPRLKKSIRTASELADGLVLVIGEDGEETLYSEKLACVQCGASVPEFEPRSFSFNSRYGACENCGGLGVEWEFDLDKLIPDPSKPFAECGWPRQSGFSHPFEAALGYARIHKVSLKPPWKDLPASVRDWVLYGAPRSKPRRKGTYSYAFDGLIPYLRLELGILKGQSPPKNARPYMFSQVCSGCHGSRLKPESLGVRVAGLSITEMTSFTLSKLGDRLRGLYVEPRKQAVAESILHEIRERVDFLGAVGLGYLCLDRQSSTLSGGEAQRVRLATQIGTRLRGVLYVLDEPSIGLHSRDHARLLDALMELRDLGNTVLVVEHDQLTMERADHVVDLGPGAGRLGGKLVATGKPAEIGAADGSLTGDYLAGRRVAYVESTQRRKNGKGIVVRGARQHNLKNIDVTFPLGHLCVVTGVSGSGKSTLVNGILYPALASKVGRAEISPGTHSRIDGLALIDKVVRIDQTPIGRTPRSTPATYVGVFTPIRDVFAMLPEARARGYPVGRFSYNVYGGRCDECFGDGIKRIEMSFMPDVFVDCETCGGRRYKRETLQVKYKGYSIADILEAPVEEALDVMQKLPGVKKKLQTLVDVGLGYIQLGQSSTTISGGEAQRMKLARELSKRQTGKTVYILDEPTTGLHFDDIRKLLLVLQRLVDRGNTVIVIEHQTDVIRSADWLIDLGPEGGDAGGRVVCAGTPRQVAAVAESHTGQALRAIGVQ